MSYFILYSDYVVGFGGKFGVQADRQDKSAVGWDHVEQVPRHHSQTDHKKVSHFITELLCHFYYMHKYNFRNIQWSRIEFMSRAKNISIKKFVFMYTNINLPNLMWELNGEMVKRLQME